VEDQAAEVTKMDDEALLAAVRRIKIESPSKTAKEVFQALVAGGDVVELAAVKKFCGKVTKALANEQSPAPATKHPQQSAPRHGAAAEPDSWAQSTAENAKHRKQASEALVQAMLAENRHLLPAGVNAAALMKQVLSDPHALTNSCLLANGRDLSAVLANVEDYDIHFHCFTCRAVVPSHRNRCSRCKAIMYCSTACQKRDWKEGPGGGQYTHKHWCPHLQKHMARLPETQSLTKFFPWLRLTASGIFPRDQVLASLGLLGEDKGYWSTPSSRAPHAAQHTQQKTYGVMLHRRTLPDEEEAWMLPPADIPRLRSLSKEHSPQALGGKLLSSWPDYYQWRGLPPSSVAALLMEYPLTLYFTIGQLPQLMQRPTLTVHLLGCEKELHFLPLFGELALLLPHAHIHIMLFGEELATCYERAPAGSLMRNSPLFEYSAPPWFEAERRLTITWQPSHTTWQDAIRSGAVRPPDLAWAPNAGVAAYRQWQDAVFVCAYARVPLATSEYCEYSVEMEVGVYDRVLQQAEQKGCVGAASTKPRRFLNPFRNPGQRPFPMNLAPNHSNGFCTILDLDETG
jgi:hypothetical protein